MYIFLSRYTKVTTMVCVCDTFITYVHICTTTQVYYVNSLNYIYICIWYPTTHISWILVYMCCTYTHPTHIYTQNAQKMYGSINLNEHKKNTYTHTHREKNIYIFLVVSLKEERGGGVECSVGIALIQVGMILYGNCVSVSDTKVCSTRKKNFIKKRVYVYIT